MNADEQFEAELAASLKRTRELARANRQRTTDHGPRTEDKPKKTPPVRHAPPHDYRPVVGEDQLPPPDRREV